MFVDNLETNWWKHIIFNLYSGKCIIYQTDCYLVILGYLFNSQKKGS